MLQLSRLLLAALILAACALLSEPARAQAAPATAEAPPQVETLLRLLADPAVKQWLEQRQAGVPGTDNSPAQAAGNTGFIGGLLTTLRERLLMLIEGARRLPADFERAREILLIEFEDRGILQILLLVSAFVGLGFGTSRLFYWAARGLRARILANKLENVRDRLIAIASRLAFGLSFVAAFALGSLGGFLAFDWPPLLKELVAGYLVAFLVFRLGFIITFLLFAPGAERFRIVPMTTAAARHWTLRIRLIVAWSAFAAVTFSHVATLGFSAPTLRFLGSLSSLILLILVLEAIWRRPLAEPAHANARRFSNSLLSVYAAALWLARIVGAFEIVWGLAVAGGAMLLVYIVDRSVRHVLRRESADEHDGAPSVTIVCIERGVRVLIIVGAALLLARGWGLDAAMLSTGETATHRLMRGALSAGIILLIADFLWHVLATLIDKRIFLATADGAADEETRKERARLRTLLPIFRNILQIVLVVMAVLMALSALGVEIGPLIAGAGVVGVAIGFGAQTLVKDVISGVFYLLDDAFRVGEYIQSDKFKGTVESFSLRSVKLRHHRGPIYTVPFGSLGAIQNMSRDWVIDKITIGVTYDTDLEKARKLVKKIGQDFAADPEYGRHILEPPKMQGVEQFGDFAIQIRLKMKTKPGEQFVIRRKVLAAIKQSFSENGIRFAFPTVQVAGGDEAEAAAARQTLSRSEEAPQAAE